MKEKFIICDNCGSKCDINDTYCKSCSQTLSHSNCFDEQIICGIENSELKSYIGKKSNYYIEKFSKKKGKWFIQLNFAALFFGPIWFFYRKMYKFAMIYFAVFVVAFSLLNTVIPILFKSDVDEYFLAESVYLDYIDSGAETHCEIDGKFTTVPTFRAIRNDLTNAQNRIRLINFLISAPSLIINILFRLFANSFYKNHIISNIEVNNGGVSIKNAIGAYILINVVLLCVSLLISQIPIVSRFVDAALSLRPWL